MADSFVGEIRILPYGYAPDQWAWCNGQQLSPQQNQALFAVIGTLYGGDGKTTFNLPDIRGSAPLGTGNGTGLTPRAQGPKSVGETSVTVPVNQLPPHSHDFIEQSTTAPATIISNPVGAWLSHGEVQLTPPKVFNTFAPYNAASTVAFRGPALSTAGQGQAHANKQPYLAMNFCISLAGNWPPRPD